MLLLPTAGGIYVGVCVCDLVTTANIVHNFTLGIWLLTVVVKYENNLQTRCLKKGEHTNKESQNKKGL